MAKKVPSTAPRPPPPAAAEDLARRDAFVRAEPSHVSTSRREDVQTPARADVKAPARRDTVRVVRKRDGAALRRLTVYLPQDLATALQVHCARRDENLGDALTRAVRALLDRERE
jgi:hypothetical protein